MIRVLFAAFALLAASCAAPPASEPTAAGEAFVGIDGKPLLKADGTIDHEVVQALTANPEACAKAGGEVRKVCLMGTPMCVVTFKDAGKVCSDGSECGSGSCRLAEMGAPAEQPGKGICAPTNDPCGCFQMVEDGIVQHALCAD